MAKYWSSKEEKYLPIPKAAWYVLSNDSFMSGWGYAKGKINTCVVPCLSYHQAMIVRDYVLAYLAAVGALGHGQILIADFANLDAEFGW